MYPSLLTSNKNAALCVAPSIDSTFKMDEGFSEDSRSQDGGDTPMAFESTDVHAFSMPPQHAMEYILGLDEAERRSKHFTLVISKLQLMLV